MNLYRLVLFGPEGGVHSESAITAAHDDEALEQVARVRHPYALELWRGQVLVWRFDDRSAVRR